MKKIGIITTHRANNFGAMLQAFALVKAIEQLGADVEVIDWRCPHFEWLYHKAWRMHRNPIPALKRWLYFQTVERKSRERFDRFRSQLPLTPPYTNKKQLEGLNNRYDAFIVGSDQVWNPHISAYNKIDFDRAYLLDFVNEKRKKLAYAASIGVSKIEPSSLTVEYKKALSDFASITMREEAGAELVERLIGRRPPVVLDPVLLHGRTFWESAFGEDLCKAVGPYVLLYNIKFSRQLRHTAVEYARQHGLKLVEVIVPAQPFSRQPGVDVWLQAGPAEFVRALACADAVFTNSFHASAFSIIFNRILCVETSLSSGNSNSRLDTLFGISGIKRWSTELSRSDKSIVSLIQEVEWREVEKNVETAKERSIQYLAQSIMSY